MSLGGTTGHRVRIPGRTLNRPAGILLACESRFGTFRVELSSSTKRETLESKIEQWKAFQSGQALAMREYKKSIGLCIELRCGNDAHDGAVRCEYHLELAALASKRAYDRRKKK